MNQRTQDARYKIKQRDLQRLSHLKSTEKSKSQSIVSMADKNTRSPIKNQSISIVEIDETQLESNIYGLNYGIAKRENRIPTKKVKTD